MNPGICWATKDPQFWSFTVWDSSATFEGTDEMGQPSSCRCDAISPQIQSLEHMAAKFRHCWILLNTTYYILCTVRTTNWILNEGSVCIHSHCILNKPAVIVWFLFVLFFIIQQLILIKQFDLTSKVQQHWDFWLYVSLRLMGVLITNCWLLGYFITSCTKKMDVVPDWLQRTKRRKKASKEVK